MEHIIEALTLNRANGREIRFSVLPISRALLSGETMRAEESVIGFPDGRLITTVVNAAPILSNDGEFLFVVVTVQEMSHLEDLERARAEFLGLVGEEPRTPLSTIKSSTIARRGIVQSLSLIEPLQLLRIVDQQTALMRNQINSLIELTRLETRALVLSPGPRDPADLVNSARTEFERNHAGVPGGMG